MKLKVEKSTIEAFGIVATFGLKELLCKDFPLMQTFVRTSLESLIIKLAKAKTRICKSLTIQITPSEALAFHLVLQAFGDFCPGKPEYLISLEYFIQPIQKQIV